MSYKISLFFFVLCAFANTNAEIMWNGDWAMQCDFEGNDIGNVQCRGEDCSTKCEENPECNHYAWTTYNGGTCWLKKGNVSKCNAFINSDPTCVCGVISYRLQHNDENEDNHENSNEDYNEDYNEDHDENGNIDYNQDRNQDENDESIPNLDSCLIWFNLEALEEHNRYRVRHGVPKISFDLKIVKSAQNYALKLAKDDEGLIHSEGPYGENLYMQTSVLKTDADCAEAGKSMSSAWYNEVKDYNFNHPGFSMNTGHFTALIWRETQKVGFGLAKGKSGWYYGVGQYDPSGNWDGQYEKNVPPPLF